MNEFEESVHSAVEMAADRITLEIIDSLESDIFGDISYMSVREDDDADNEDTDNKDTGNEDTGNEDSGSEELP